MSDEKCVHCDNGLCVRQPYTHHETIGHFVTSETRGESVCEACGEVEMTGGALAAYQRRAALAALEQGPCRVTGAMLRYARKALGYTRVAFGDAAHVTLAEIDHAEEYGSDALRLTAIRSLREREAPGEVTISKK